MSKDIKKTFRVYFFKAIRGNETIGNILNSLLEDVSSVKMQHVYGRKCQFLKCEKSKIGNEDIFLGDLQSIHENDLPDKVRIDESEKKILKQAGFANDEGLGYNNCFAYLPSKKILLLQNNINGVGYLSLIDMLNNSKAMINDEDISLAIACDDNAAISRAENFTEIEFSITKWQNVDELPLMDIKNSEKFEVESCKVKLQNRTSFFDKGIISDFISKLVDNKKNYGVKTLKTKCNIDGENTELNFLQNKITYKNQISISAADKVMKYDVRKLEIQNSVRFYLNNYTSKS